MHPRPKSEPWICDRTGHKSSQMLNRYRRLARTWEEANLAAFTPLHLAVPELAAAFTAADAAAARRLRGHRSALTRVFLRWAMKDLNLQPTD